MINDLISDILKLNVDVINYKEILDFNYISEYEFSLIKTECKLQNKEEIDIYFKFIKKDKIKESIFCYWCLLYQEEMKKVSNGEKSSIFNQVVISELERERYKNSILLEIKNNKTDIIKDGTEIHFIDLFKYLECNKIKSQEALKWNNYLKELDNSLLFVGVVLNKEIGRMSINVL